MRGYARVSLALPAASPADRSLRAVGMTLDEFWYLADEAANRAEQAYHDVRDAHGDGVVEPTHRKRVSRGRFRTLVDRIRRTGAPYGAHTVVYRDGGDLLLVRHEGVDMWVLPGGEQRPDESFREAAERELGEEAGVEAEYGGLAMLGRVEVRCDGHETWGVLPVFAARAATTEPTVRDPDGEISDARWFDELPADTRDREHILAWRRRALD